MRIKAWFMLAGAMFLVVPVAYAQANGCTANGTVQNCYLTEGYDWDNLSPEPTVTVKSAFAPDLQVGYVPIYEDGSTATNFALSDYLVFTDSGNGYADAMTLYSADALGQWPPSLDLTGLDPIQVYDLNGNALWGVVETGSLGFPQGIPVNFGIWEGVAGTGPFFDTFSVNSDPTPEPGTLLLIGSGIMLAVRKLRT